MTIEKALLVWLSDNQSLDAWWLERPASANRCIVYRNISPSFIGGNLASTNLRRDLVSITVYHDDVEIGKAAAEKIMTELNDFSGDFGGLLVQLSEFQSGFDQILHAEAGSPVYQFNRDFLITY
jgi:hypothetical protein